MERSLRAGDLVRTHSGECGRIREVSRAWGGGDAMATLTMMGGDLAALPTMLLAPVEEENTSTVVNTAITRLPRLELGEIAEHLVRWHGVPIERVQGMTLGRAFDHHASLHEVAEAAGQRLGHVHNLTAAEAEILEQGAHAALRRSR